MSRNLCPTRHRAGDAFNSGSWRPVSTSKPADSEPPAVEHATDRVDSIDCYTCLRSAAGGELIMRLVSQGLVRPGCVSQPYSGLSRRHLCDGPEIGVIHAPDQYGAAGEMPRSQAPAAEYGITKDNVTVLRRPREGKRYAAAAPRRGPVSATRRCLQNRARSSLASLAADRLVANVFTAASRIAQSCFNTRWFDEVRGGQ